MGLFGPSKTCAICGGKVGLLSGYSLAGDNDICGDCVDKCTPGAKDLFKNMTPEDVQANMQLAIENKKKGEELFSATRIFYTGCRHDKPMVEVDEVHGWFKNVSNKEGWVYELDAISNYSMHLTTVEVDPNDQTDREASEWMTSPSFYGRFPDLPRCPIGQRITGVALELRFLNNELGVKELSIDMLPGFFTDQDDYMGAFECCNDFYEFMRERKMTKSMQYNAPAAAAAAPVSQSDNMDALKKLHELLEAGILSQAEYDAKKKQLLGL